MPVPIPRSRTVKGARADSGEGSAGRGGCGGGDARAKRQGCMGVSTRPLTCGCHIDTPPERVGHSPPSPAAQSTLGPRKTRPRQSASSRPLPAPTPDPVSSASSSAGEPEGPCARLTHRPRSAPCRHTGTCVRRTPDMPAAQTAHSSAALCTPYILLASERAWHRGRSDDDTILR